VKNIVIAGTGGLASEVTEYISDSNNDKLLGYLDCTDENMTKYDYTAPLLGHENNFVPKKDICFLIAIANVEIGKKVAETLISKGLKPYTLIHNTCQISKTATIGEGNILAPFSMVGPKSTIGNFNLINYYTAVTHDVRIGNWNSISPRTTITGGVQIGDDNIFGTGVSILPFKTVGNRCKVQSGVTVFKNIPDEHYAKTDTELNISKI